MTTNRPIWRAGTFTSSADCGMTSNPTNRNGTTTRTAKKPATPPVNSGCMLSGEPPVNDPNTSIRPMTSSSTTTNVWTTLANFTPRMLMVVMTIAAIEPTSAQVR